ncbi:acetamidase/formamidase family protein [Paenibacillus sp. FA6]|uniref:acetamidase/formamidase family protein n=1 Tax=Paenibacillus sp. FA6 TaxID=3413029 RepID=UPI003F65BC2D
MAVYNIQLSNESLIGLLTTEVKPCVSIKSGDTLRFETLDAGWGTGKSYKERIKPFARKGSGHALVGPIFIEEAKKGMTIKIHFNEIKPGQYGFTAAGEYPNWQNEQLFLLDYKEIILDWKLDNQMMKGSCHINERDFTVPLKPFMGVVGMPPEQSGDHSTWPPRFCGGNIDCKEIVKGSTLYLPISVDGAYLVIGEGHAMQGDGEVSCQAIECPMELVDVTIEVLEDMVISLPRANTPSGWLTFGFDEDLNKATVQALDQMLDLIGEQYGLNRVEAIALGSSIIDLRITQIVNGVKGVHACLPHDILL